MDKKRLLTGSVLVLLAFVILFVLTPLQFAFITSFIMLIAGWEWGRLAGLTKLWSRAFYLLVLFILMWLIYSGVWLVNKTVPVETFLWIISAYWIVSLYFIFRYPSAAKIWSSRLVRMLMGFITLLPCWFALNFIRGYPNGDSILLLLFLIVWSADIGAYFAGRRVGKHKLMPRVSPGKTWQGALGGLLLSFVVAVPGFIFLYGQPFSWLNLFLMVFVLNVFAITGDLFESMLKRHVNLKDSGVFLPGHGGVLDRLDSLMAVAPIFLLGMLLNWY